MKTIVVKWIPEKGLYDMAMKVIESDHERFIKGSRFDFGFFKIATAAGYTIISLPLSIDAKCHMCKGEGKMRVGNNEEPDNIICPECSGKGHCIIA